MSHWLEHIRPQITDAQALRPQRAAPPRLHLRVQPGSRLVQIDEPLGERPQFLLDGVNHRPDGSAACRSPGAAPTL